MYKRQTLSIAQRAVATLINYNGVGDLYRMYLTTRRANASFNLAYIGPDFHAEHKEEFDTGYMRALYRFAFDKAAKGYPWQDAPSRVHAFGAFGLARSIGSLTFGVFSERRCSATIVAVAKRTWTSAANLG